MGQLKGKFTAAAVVLTAGVLAGGWIGRVTKRKQAAAKKVGKHVPYGAYEALLKRPFDVVCALAGLIVLSPIMLTVALLVRVKLGKPVIFTQKRPGKDGKIFKLYKFRSMSDARDEKGELLPDEERLGKFGKSLRATSFDELPELVNILRGDMSVVGPRPLLVRDMVFMSYNQKKRHGVLPGLTGLAQIEGRNRIDWETKLDYDLKYIRKITFLSDIKIILKTVNKVLVSKDGITEIGTVTATDYGDYLFAFEKVSKEIYDRKQIEAERLLNG